MGQAIIFCRAVSIFLLLLLWPPYVIGQAIYIFILSFVMVALWNRADHYIFILSFVLLFMAALCNRGGALYFCPVISIFLLLLFFSSPNLSGHRSDVYHTSTHGVALVRI